MISTSCFIAFFASLLICDSSTTSNFVLYKHMGVLKISDRKYNTNLQKWIAESKYTNDVNKSGFAYLEVKTNPAYSNEKQAYCAGFIEGAVTSELIYSHWYNTVKNICEGIEEQCAKVNKFLTYNTNWVQGKYKSNESSSYWHHVKLFYTQVLGMLDGYNKYATTPTLTWTDIMWLNLAPDISDLSNALSKTKTFDGRCSVLIKILSENRDIYFSHDTWWIYQSMLKIQRRYIFHYSATAEATETVPGKEMTFTGFPGSIASQDDFYLISSGLAATETTNGIFNTSLWNHVTPHSVLESVRSVVANRLADSGESWRDVFQLYNSGTYNNQWMILDYKRFKPGRTPANGTLWVIEQIPSKVVSNDLTHILVKDGYWASYNIPFYKEIYELSGYATQYEKYGRWFSYDDAPRPQIFRRDQSKVTNMAAFMTLMRSNDYQHDPAARCICDPPYSATGAIAARDDLNPANGTYHTKWQGHRPEGAIDAKITNSTLFSKLQFVAVSGPTTGTYGQLPPFDWRKSDFKKLPHRSQPDVWNFKPVLHKWELTEP